MEVMFEILLQFLGEIGIQLVMELLAELGLHSVEDTLKRPRHPVWSTIGFAICGAMAGGISLLILPASPIADIELRRVNLIVTPLVAGGAMALIGRRKERRGIRTNRLDRFGYAFAFALAMAAVRYVWAK